MEDRSLNSAPEEMMRALPMAEGDDLPFGEGGGFFRPALNWMARRSEMAAVLIGFLVALFFVPNVLSFQERDDPERQVYNLVPFQFLLESAEYRLYDERFAKRGPELPDSRKSIAIVKIDAASLAALDQWPWPRSFHARLIKRLKKAGAKVIAIDLDFSSKQMPRPDGTLSSEDVDLINTARDAGNVIFPTFFSRETKTNMGKSLTEDRYVSPFQEDEKAHAGLNEVTPDVGLAVLPQDSDSGYRRYPFVSYFNGEQMGGFALLACGLFQDKIRMEGHGANRDWESGPYDALLRQKAWPPIGGGLEDVPLRPARYSGRDAPVFEYMPIHWWGSEDTFPSYSYRDVLDGYSDATLKMFFRNRIVFVGATDKILKDLFPIPPFRKGLDIRTQIPGVEIHATAAAMLLDGEYIHPPNIMVTWWTLFGLTLFSAAWTEMVREHISRISRLIQQRWHKRRRLRGMQVRVQDAVWFVLYGLVALLPSFLFWEACIYFFTEYKMWVVAAYPILSACTASALVLVFLFTVESAERRKVIYQMGLYMDRDIMEEVLTHPEGEYAKPQRTVATVMFTDLEGFTNFSEANDAGEVVAVLNAFMTRMKPIIRRYGGCVDKYIGDAIMCYFGVPLERYDHAERALACAIELQEECVRFRLETGVSFKMRVGIHTGEVIAGSVGAEGLGDDTPHFNYTVIGDTVNLAARLETKNKEFGSWIMCSGATFASAPDIVDVVPARTAIKGKSQEVEVYIVRGLKGEPPRDEAWGGKLHLPDHMKHLLDEDGLTALPHGVEDEPEPELLALPQGAAEEEFPAPGS